MSTQHESKNLVEMCQIFKNFGHIQALRGVDFALKRGEVVGLVGDNGAGKSTLMKVLFGVYRPNGGEIFISGDKVTFDSPLDAREMGIEIIYQEFALAEDLNITQNIFLGKELTRNIFRDFFKILDKKRMQEESRKILKNLDIEVHSVETEVTMLSGGQRQAVAIARTMTFKPRLIIMDEPTASLSVEKAKKLLNTIKSLKGHGVSVVFITHRLQDIFDIADRVVVLWQGKKVMDTLIDKLTIEKTIAAMVGNLKTVS